MPHELQQRVANVRQSWNRRTTIELVCWLAAAVVGLLLLAGMIDFAVRISDRGLRVLLTGALATAAAYVIWRLARGWRQRRWSDLAAARQVQESYPHLGDRLASSLEFLRQEEDDPTAGSAPLRRSVVADTTAAIHDLSLDEVAHSSAFRNATVAATTAALVALGLAIASPAAVQTALARLTAPWNNVEWPRLNNLVFVDAPTVVARGQTFEASLIDESGDLPDEVRIEYRYKIDGRRRTDDQWMQRVGDRAVARRENVMRPFAYRAVGGDHHTMAWTEVEVVDPPAIEGLTLTLHPPKYSGLASSMADSRSRILSGSQIELTGRANGPLKGAFIETAEEKTIACRIRGEDRREVYLPPGVWTLLAEENDRTDRFRLRLVADNGLVAMSSPTDLRIVVDRPPLVNWSEATKDFFVLPSAAVPMEIEVADDLAISNSQLLVKGANPTEGDDQPHRISLFHGEKDPPELDAMPRQGQTHDQRAWEHLLDLATMKLAPGSVLEVRAEATDYQPAVGTSPLARRLTIISEGELEARLAEAQAEILRLLEQALADQRSARGQATRLAAEAALDAPTTQATLDGLLTGRLEQQTVRRVLVTEDKGVVDLTHQLLQAIAINRLQRPELVAQLENIAARVEELDGGALPSAEGQLTDLRKQFESNLAAPPTESDVAAIRKSFGDLDADQLTVIETLEALIEDAGQWSDADRFVRELARLEQEQRELREATADAARRQVEALADPNSEGVEQAELDRLAAEQADLSRRFGKLTQAMQQLADKETTDSELTQRLNDALAEAQANNLAGQMTDGARQIEREQLARAADSQAESADKLRDLVELLRDRRPTDPSELAERLRQLQKELAQLQEQAAEAEQNSDRRQQEQQREDLAEQLERLAREMNRMTAEAAGESTQEAARQASPSPQESASESQESMQRAQEQMEQAQQQLAQRIAELEDERQQRLLERLAQVLDELIPRQQKVLEETLKLELIHEQSGALSETDLQRSVDLSRGEENIAHELSEAIEDLATRAVFQLALEGAADDMRQAAGALEKGDTGRVTQGLELGALARMRHVRDVLRDEPPPPSEQEPQEGEGGQGGEQRPPLIELAEVKMLRWLQVDLNGRTRLYEADLADNPQIKASKQQAAQRLSKEQTRLEELVQEMMRRNNDTNPPKINL